MYSTGAAFGADLHKGLEGRTFAALRRRVLKYIFTCISDDMKLHNHYFWIFFFKIKRFLLILISTIFLKLAVSYKRLQYFVKCFFFNAILVWIRCLQDACTLFICAMKCAWLADRMISRQNVYSANFLLFNSH